MIHLAELNQDNVCIGTKTVKSMINDGRHVEIGQPDFDYYSFRKYDEETGWSVDKFLPDYPQIELDRMAELEARNVQLEQSQADQDEIIMELLLGGM